jgi:hypothetical protein
MRQLFFIAPNGYPQVKATGLCGGTHGWCAEGDDPTKDQIIGVVELGNKNADAVIDKLEAAGIMWLPNHERGQVIKPEHAAALAKHGVLPTHTTAEAMTIVHGKSGFPPHKISRF